MKIITFAFIFFTYASCLFGNIPDISFPKNTLKESKNIILLIEPKSGYILESSHGARVYYGYSNLIGMNISQINTLNPEEIKTEMQRAQLEERNYFHFKHLLKNTEIRDVYVTSYPIQRNNDTLLLSFITDVTDELKKNSNIHLLKTLIILCFFLATLSTLYLLSKIKEKEKRYSDLFNNMSEAIIIYEIVWSKEKRSLVRKCISANPYFEKLTGININKVIGKCLCEILPIFDSRLNGIIGKISDSTEPLAFKLYVENRDSYYNFHLFSPSKNRFALAFTDISEQEKLKLQLEYEKEKAEEMATHDYLTKLPNRALLRERVENSIAIASRNSSNIAICMIDLDGFKQINDTYGHLVGDQLLIEISKKIKNSLRSFDTLSRFGGDEFVCLLTHFSGHNNCQAIIERIIESSKEIIKIGDIEIKPSFSIGVSYYPDDGSSYEELMKNADKALYEAKNEGKNRYVFYDKFCLL